MRKAAHALFALASLLGACSPRSIAVTIGELPPEVSWGALVFEDREGAVLASTELTPRRFGETFAIAAPEPLPDAALVRFAGWSAPALAPVLPADPNALHAQPITRAGDTDARLPPATWAARGTLQDSTADLARDPDAPALTAPWLPDCPLLVRGDVEHLVDASCAAMKCATPIDQRGCALHLDATECFSTTLEGTVAPDGSVSLDSALLGHCARTRESGDAALELACGGSALPCEVRVYDRPFPARFETRTVKLIDVPGFDSSTVPIPSGYIPGLASLGDRIAAGVRSDGDPRACAAHGPDAVYFVDPDSMAVSRGPELADCLTGLARDPMGDGFVAVFGGDAHRIGRFDGQGNRIVLQDAGVAELTRDHFAVQMISDAGARPLIAVAYRSTPDTTIPQYVVSYDPATLAPVTVSRFAPKIAGISLATPGKIGVLEQGVDRVFTIDLDRGGSVDDGLYIASVAPQRSTNLGVLAYHHASAAYLASSKDRQAALYYVDGATNPGAAFFERVAYATSISAWPADPRLAAVGLLAFDGGGEAILALFDPRPPFPRYLPGAVEIGHGEVRHAVEDARGRLWVSLPHTAELARATAP